MLQFMRGEWTGSGHSPLGALSVLALLGAISIQVCLGLVSQDEDGLYFGPLARLVSSDTSDKARDLHEFWFNVLLGLVILHLAAIAYYRVRGQKLIKPMITGRAGLGPDAEPMQPAKWWIALICLAVGIGVTRWVVAGAPPFGP
jgi:cytochrome b